MAHADNLQPADLCEMLHVSPEAMGRHLKKLKTLGVVHLTRKGCALAPPGSDLAKDLLDIILS